MSVATRKNKTVVCEELKYEWHPEELIEIGRLWQEQFTINHIARYFRRDRREVVIALLEILNDTQLQLLFGDKWGVRTYRKPIKAVCID
ncbi:hypothetical protein [Bacillus sp. FJAT-28004]|uniref:hypothetical protein n=1 Tax=Bacillus sp. FJAT-28004 TaxID=1679165 RepID=UPI0006B44305|nr:hypothetical protein [Bacillus sp. FJAT-28004]